MNHVDNDRLEAVRDAAHQEPTRRTELLAGALILGFAVVATAVIVGWQALLDLDAEVSDALHEFALRAPGIVDAAISISVTGSAPVLWSVIGVAALWLGFIHGQWKSAVFLVVAESLGVSLNLLVKALVGRPRPSFDTPVAIAPGESFPSGHSMNSAICYSLVVSVLLFSGFVSRRIAVPVAVVLAILVVAIGVTRVFLGVHYTSDVIGGWLLGVGWVALTTAIVRPWGDARRRARDEAIHREPVAGTGLP